MHGLAASIETDGNELPDVLSAQVQGRRMDQDQQLGPHSWSLFTAIGCQHDHKTIAFSPQYHVGRGSVDHVSWLREADRDNDGPELEISSGWKRDVPVRSERTSNQVSGRLPGDDHDDPGSGDGQNGEPLAFHESEPFDAA